MFTENDEQNKTKTIRVFSDTRWTVRCGALASIIQHYEELKELWKRCLKACKDTETKARIIGVQTQMNKFNYFCGVKLAILLLRHSDNLSTTLQNPKLSASQAQSIARKTVVTLEKLRDDDYFLLFWKEVLTESRQLDIDEPAYQLETTRMSLKPFSTITQNFSESNFLKNLNNFTLHVVKSKKRTFHHYLM